jgi:hypothetical protein
MPSDRLATAIGAMLLLAVLGCSSEEEAEIFSAETAQDVGQHFHEALLAGDAAAAARLARFPFRYKELARVWPDAAAFQANLAKESPRFHPLLVGLDRVEAFSRRDLLAGRWPRHREVPEDRRLEAVQALGIEPYGWLVRVHSESRPGYLLVLNPDGVERLAVQMLDL